MQNTIIIWDECGGSDIQFFVVTGDHTDLDGVMLNCSTTEDDVADRLNDLLFDNEGRCWRTPPLTSFPHQAYTPGATAVIVCGMVP